MNDNIQTIEGLTEEEQQLLNQTVEENFQGISENSPTALIDDTTSRFSSAVWYENIQNKCIIIAGIGGIGSFVSLFISRLKPTAMYIYDDDIVETANLSGQLYRINDIGLFKVDALFSTIKDFSNYESIFAISDKFTESCSATNIMICGFDSMQSRKIFFNSWLNHVMTKPENERKNCLFIDGRLSVEDFQIFCIQGNDTYNIERYKKEFLFSDSEAEEVICSYKQTTFCASMIASYITNLFINFCANEVGAYRSLPFLTVYNAETMYLKTEE